MKSFLAAAASILAISATANAASFSFEFLYDGTTLTSTGADAAGTSLDVGDDMTMVLNASGSNGWEVIADYTNAFVPFSFAVSQAGTRIATINTQFLLDGMVVDSFSDSGVSQSSFHVGAQSFTLPIGFQFDQIIVEWEMTGGDLATISTTLPFGFGLQGVWENDALEFGAVGSEIPVPAAGLLFAAGGLGLFGAKRRKA